MSSPVSDAPAASVSSKYFYRMEKRYPLPATRDAGIEDRTLDFCSRITGAELRS